MRKGNIVKITKNVVNGLRPLTESEIIEWYNSPASKGINSAGESKLPPTCTSTQIKDTDILVVERARCAVQLTYGRPTPGMTLVLLPSGETTYVKRNLLQIIS